jgi:agmatine deiminase
MSNTPVGYSMPAEWNRHSSTWMLFPYRKDTWKDNALPAQIAFLNVAKSISKFEHVKMGCLPSLLNHAKNLLTKDGLTNYNITFYEMEYDDGWMRDTGPTFIIKKEQDNNNSNILNLAGIDWIFNAWGGLIPSCEKDERVASKILEIESISASFKYKAGKIIF